MNFLPDLYVACPVCEGRRFNRQTLEIRYREMAQQVGMFLLLSLMGFALYNDIHRLVVG